jgi:hypothetical protein
VKISEVLETTCHHGKQPEALAQIGQATLRKSTPDSRCRRLTTRGGRFLLFTQNPTAWHRNRYAHAPSPDQLRHWLTLAEIREHCTVLGFRVHAVQTIAPAGDQGALWWRPYGQGALRRIIGRPRAARLFERLGLERTLVVEAVAARAGVALGTRCADFTTGLTPGARQVRPQPAIPRISAELAAASAP